MEVLNNYPILNMKEELLLQKIVYIQKIGKIDIIFIVLISLKKKKLMMYVKII